MNHASTRAVFEYWNKRRGTRPAPERGDIEPTDIRHALGDTFMLAMDFVDQLCFRLAGTRVCARSVARSKARPSPIYGAKEAAGPLAS